MKRKLKELITKTKLGITRVRRRQQRLTSSSKRHLDLALGIHQKLWPKRLRLSAKERALEGRSMPRSDPGKADEGGEMSLLTEKLKSGLRSAFNRTG